MPRHVSDECHVAPRAWKSDPLTGIHLTRWMPVRGSDSYASNAWHCLGSMSYDELVAISIKPRSKPVVTPIVLNITFWVLHAYIHSSPITVQSWLLSRSSHQFRELPIDVMFTNTCMVVGENKLGGGSTNLPVATRMCQRPSRKFAHVSLY